MPSRKTLDLMGAAEIADHLGVSRQRVTQLQNTENFPAPVARLAMGAVWDAEAIKIWAAKHRPKA